METNKIPSAEEFLISNAQVYTEDFDYEELVGKNDVFDTKDNITSVMIAFAELHVEAALKAAAIHAEVRSVNWDDYTIDSSDILYKDIDDNVRSYKINEDSILNSYPLSNIK